MMNQKEYEKYLIAKNYIRYCKKCGAATKDEGKYCWCDGYGNTMKKLRRNTNG